VTVTAIRTCEVCSTPIDHMRRQAKVCSASCRGRKARREPYLPPRNCELCGDRCPAGRADRRFCSDRCRRAAWQARQDVSRERLCALSEPSEAPLEGPTRPKACECDSQLAHEDPDLGVICTKCGKRKQS
jgi:predicted nucleic acid-binding Zn ribbon protein